MAENLFNNFGENEQGGVEYRAIPGFGYYRVGNDGSVWSCRVRGSCQSRKGPWWKVKTRTDKHGYVVARFMIDKKRTHHKLHRLIAMAFLGPCPEGMQCRHLDGNPKNNHIDNLCWGTPMDNQSDKDRHGTNLCGEDHNMCILTENDVQSIRRSILAGAVQRELAKHYNVSAGTINDIARRRTWQHLPWPSLGPVENFAS